MNNENNNKEKENCPLCETTKEAVDMLNANKDSEINPVRKGGALDPNALSKKGGGLYSSQPQGAELSNGVKDKKSSWKIKTMVWSLVIILGLFGGYKILSNSLLTKTVAENNLIQEQSTNISEKIGPQINALAPNFVSEDVFGNKITLNSFRDKKPVLLVFWATWCSYCAQEKDDLKTFSKRYQDKIQVLAVDSGEPKQVIKDYIEKEDINFLIVLDEQRKIWNQYLVRGTPSHFLIGKDGKIITLRPGLASLADMETMLSMISVE